MTPRFYHRIIVLFILVSCWGIACSHPGTVVEMPAAEINLAAADLGPGWSLTQEMDLDDLPQQIRRDSDIQDANQRLFVAREGRVTSGVLKTRSTAVARTGMRGVLVHTVTQKFQEQLPGTEIIELEAPGTGQESRAFRLNVPDLDQQVYLLFFRQANVFVTLTAVGPPTAITADRLLEYSQQLEARIHTGGRAPR
jgi:hypothetical protein